MSFIPTNQAAAEAAFLAAIDGLKTGAAEQAALAAQVL